MTSNNIFGKHHFSAGETKIIELSDRNLFIKREKEGWHILTSPESNIETPDFSKGEYFQSGKSNSLVIAPALPAKPLVFKGNHLNVTPKQKLTFFLKIPITLQVYYSKNLPDNLLQEIPSKRISDTWFGEADNGEPAFALGSEYQLYFENMETTPLEAICPVSILNNSTGTLEVQRLIIRVENLSIYKNGDKNVTNVVQVEYKGQEVMSSVEYHYSKVFDGDKQEIITKPRNTAGKNLLKINFHFIKNMYKID